MRLVRAAELLHCSWSFLPESPCYSRTVPSTSHFGLCWVRNSSRVHKISPTNHEVAASAFRRAPFHIFFSILIVSCAVGMFQRQKGFWKRCRDATVKNKMFFFPGFGKAYTKFHKIRKVQLLVVKKKESAVGATKNCMCDIRFT